MLRIFKLQIDENRIFGLDILRALSILFIIVGHGTALLPKNLAIICDYFVLDGVTIFFVLSGFLIGGILINLIQKNDFNFVSLKRFWIYRWFRTIPNYILILTILWLLNVLFTANLKHESIANYYLFSQNLYTPHPSFFPEAWSLSIEEWFYIIFPLLLIVTISILKISPKKAILFVALNILIFSLVIRYNRYANFEFNTYTTWDNLFRKQVITRLDSVMFGVLGAYIYHYYSNWWNKLRSLLFFFGILILLASKFIFPEIASIHSLYNCVFSLSIVAIGTLFTLPYLNSIRYKTCILCKTITYISLSSYSMYLLNYSIIQCWILVFIPWKRITQNEDLIILFNYSTYWILVICLSILLYKYFEIPTTKLREKFR